MIISIFCALLNFLAQGYFYPPFATGAAPTTRQYMVPGIGEINGTGTRQILVPGTAEVNQ